MGPYSGPFDIKGERCCPLLLKTNSSTLVYFLKPLVELSRFKNAEIMENIIFFIFYLILRFTLSDSTSYFHKNLK